MTETDESLFSRYLEGQKPALEALVARHFAPAYPFAHRAPGDPAAATEESLPPESPESAAKTPRS